MRIDLSLLAIVVLFNLSPHVAVADDVDKTEVKRADIHKPVERNSVEREFSARWTQAAVNALRARGDPESRALALLLQPRAFASLRSTLSRDGVGHRADKALAPAEEGVDAAAIEAAALALEAEDNFVLDALEQLPPEIRAAVAAEIGSQSDVDTERQLTLGARLTKAAPEDVAGWLMQLNALHLLSAKPAEVDALLHSMAEGVRGTSNWNLGLVRRLDAALASVPPPKHQPSITWRDVLGTNGKFREGGIPLDQPISLETYRTLQHLNMSSIIAIPGYSPLIVACNEANGAQSIRASDCTRIGRQLALNGATHLDSSIGLGIWHRQVEGSPAEAEVVAAKRRHHWQSEQMAALSIELSGTPEGLNQYAALIRASTGDEADLLRDLMHERGIPLTPPPQWLPKNPEVLQARR